MAGRVGEDPGQIRDLGSTKTSSRNRFIISISHPQPGQQHLEHRSLEISTSVLMCMFVGER